jgi:hypothetical protein
MGTTGQVALAAGATVKIDTKPNDRFGPRGGHVRIRAKQINTANVAIVETVFIGNELIENRALIAADTVGSVDNFTPAVEGVGGPGDVIDVTYTNTGTAATVLMTWVVEIENA